jgi:signal transduction histidine kinase
VKPEPLRTGAVLAIQAALALLVWGALAFAVASGSWLFDVRQASGALKFFWQFPVIGFAGAVLLPSFLYDRLREEVAARGPAAGDLTARVLGFPRLTAIADFGASVFLFTLGAIELRVFAKIPAEECLKVFILGPVTGVVFGALSYLVFLDGVRPLAAQSMSRGSALAAGPSFSIVNKVILCCLALTFVTIGLYGPIALTWSERYVEAQAEARGEAALSGILQAAAHSSSGAPAWRDLLTAGLSSVEDLVVVDRRGTRLASVSTSTGEIPFFDRPENRELLTSVHPGSFVSRRDENLVISTALLPTGERIFAATRPDPATEKALLADVIRISAAVFVLAVVLSWAAGRGVAGPIASLEKAARKFALDPEHETVPRIPADDETGTLSSAFSEMADSVRAMRERLARSERLAGAAESLAAVAHEIRNPLFGITTTVASLEAELGRDAQHAKHFEVVSRESQRLSRMIDEMLSLKSGPTMSLQPGDLEGVVRSAVEWLPKRFPGRDVRVALAAAQEVPSITLDPLRLSRVFSNLLENAVLASADPVEITVRVFARDGEAVVEVEDRGEGIPPEDLEKIFDPFFSLRPNGTGLGLSICRRVVEEHGGRIEAENRAQGGSVFRVFLPGANRITPEGS